MPTSGDDRVQYPEPQVYLDVGSVGEPGGLKKKRKGVETRVNI